MQEPIVVFEDNSEASNGSEGPFPRYLLDGRNRRDALRLLGIKGEVEIPHGSITCDPVRTINAMCRATGSNGLPDGWKVNTDPVTFVLSMNVRRRHLTSEQKRAAIEAYAKANPKASNRKVAKDLGVSDHTVADVRGDQNSQNANIDHSPVERAKQVLRDNPALSQRAAAKLAEVSPATVAKARKEIGEKPKLTVVKEGPVKPKAKKEIAAGADDDHQDADAEAVENGQPEAEYRGQSAALKGALVMIRGAATGLPKQAAALQAAFPDLENFDADCDIDKVTTGFKEITDAITAITKATKEIAAVAKMVKEATK
jgi:DNA-binding XRE family transcriptional regulator